MRRCTALFRWRGRIPQEKNLKSFIRKRSVVIGGFKTSVSLETDFWNGLHAVAKDRGKSLSDLLGEIDRDRRQTNLSSAIRLFVLHNIDRIRNEIGKSSAGSNGRANSQAVIDGRPIGLGGPSFIGLGQLHE